MKVRKLVLMVLSAVLPASLLSCGLATAEQYVEAGAQVWLVGKDRVLYSVNVQFLATTELSNTADAVHPAFAYLVVRAAACPKGKCGASTVYVQELVRSQYDMSDLKRVVVRSGSFGGGFEVTWTGAGPEMAVDTVPNVSGTDVDVSSAWPATASVKAFGRTCTDKAASAARHTHAAPHAFTKPVGKAAPFGHGPGLPPKPATCTVAPRR